MISNLPYQVLYELALILHKQDLGTRKIMQTILAHAGEITGITQGFMVTFAADESVASAYILATDSTSEDGPSEPWETLLSRGLIGYVYHGRRTVVIRNIQTDSRWPTLPDDAHFPKIGSAIGIPLIQETEVFGAILFLHPEVDFFHNDQVELLEEIAKLGVAALHRTWDFDLSGKGSIRYQTLFDDAVVPMILTDLNGTIVTINRKAGDMLGYERHELLLKSITTINSIDLQKIGDDGLYRLEYEDEVTFRSEAKCANGDVIPVLLRLRRLKLSSGNLVEWIQQDVTPQMELEQLRYDLTAMVYHDLRGPLQNITASFQKLVQVLAKHENPVVRTLLQIGTRSSRQLRRMIDSLLDVQQLEEGSAILDRHPVEIRVVLTDAIQLVQPIAFELSQKIKFGIEKNLPMVSIDNDMIVRVIINLVENATKYTPQGGIITVSARRDNDKVRISVKDSGPGIPEAFRKIIFDKFSRVSYHSAPQGNGLGLAFCRLAVKAHEGEIWVESEEGNGSEFIFTLPYEAEGAGSNIDGELASTV